MNKGHKGKVKYISAPVMLVLFIVLAMTGPARNFRLSLSTATAVSDTLPDTTLPDTVKRADSTFHLADTADTTHLKVDTLKIKMAKDSLEAPVFYHADDSMVLDVPEKKIYLYGKKTETKYKDNDLTAPGMVFDQNTQLVTAFLKKDSTGNVIAFPAFNQGDFKSVSDTIKFSMRNSKGISKGTYTQQGDMYVYGQAIKKVSPDVFYAYKGRFTTCDLDTPHFAFVSNKIKFINNKMAITGPVHPEFEGVPIPLYLPFGIFPLTQGRHSGLLPPTFSSNEQLGISLTGLGYYKVLGDNWDVTTRADIYSYGSYGLHLGTTYYKRYHFRGGFQFDYINTKTNFKGDPDYSVSKQFQVNWTHTMDSKARPGVSFSANVHAGSSSYNSSIPNNPQVAFNNQLGSTISFSKIWKDLPFNLSISANHDQDGVTKRINVSFPNVSFSVNTQYPFRKKEHVGEMKWYENLGIGLQTQENGRTYFYDDTSAYYPVKTAIGKQISDNLQWGVTHSVPISLSLPPLSILQITPNMSYSERWYDRQSLLNWNSATQRIDTSIHRGFYSARSMSFGMSFSTNLYGLATFGKNSSIRAIHQKITPAFSISYSPDFNSQYYRHVRADSARDTITYSIYTNTVAGAFGAGRFGGITFSLADIIEMKIKDKQDTSGKSDKKVSLLNNLNISGAYNFLADSFALSILNATAGTNLFNNKVSLTANASIDPYEVNSRGVRIDRLLWKDKPFSLGRLTSANISLATQFKGGSGDNKKTEVNGAPVPGTGSLVDPYTGLPINDYQAEALYAGNAAMYTDFSVPWSLSLGYSMLYTNSTIPGFGGTISSLSQNINWNTTLGLTAKWQVSAGGTYNLTAAQLGSLNMNIIRDMHCWRMAITVYPIYPKYFSITISPVSMILKDVKYNRTRYFY